MSGSLSSEGFKKYNIDPVAKPRMTKRDVWKKRPAVMKYRTFCDSCRYANMIIPHSGSTIYFIIPMPASWSTKKKLEMNDRPHQQKPDLDNLLKAVLDALYGDDSVVWDVHVKKRWGYEGAICVSTLEQNMTCCPTPIINGDTCIKCGEIVIKVIPCTKLDPRGKRYLGKRAATLAQRKING